MSPDPEEFRTAARALLRQPLADRSCEALTLIRRHRSELTRWFRDELGYRLDATRPSVVRLAKLPGPGHEPRGLVSRSGRRFDARRYAIICLVMASAEGAGEHTTLRRLFEDVSLRASAVEGLRWDGQVAADRRVFIQAVQALQDLGVLHKADGDEERFARGDAAGDALYRLDRDRLSLLPTTSQPPSLVGSPAEVADEPYADTEQGRVLRRRHRVTRALVEEPVVYREDLSEEEIDYLRSQRGRLERLLAEVVGLTLEVRAEGWVAVDESGELSDLRWPDYGAAETAALRLCDQLRARRGRHEPAVWPEAEVTAFVRDLSEEYAGYWKKDSADAAGAERLAGEAVGILVAVRLAVRRTAGISARPAAGRYAAAEAIRPPMTLRSTETKEPDRDRDGQPASTANERDGGPATNEGDDEEVRT